MSNATAELAAIDQLTLGILLTEAKRIAARQADEPERALTTTELAALKELRKLKSELEAEAEDAPHALSELEAQQLALGKAFCEADHSRAFSLIGSIRDLLEASTPQQKLDHLDGAHALRAIDIARETGVAPPINAPPEG